MGAGKRNDTTAHSQQQDEGMVALQCNTLASSLSVQLLDLGKRPHRQACVYTDVTISY